MSSLHQSIAKQKLGNLPSSPPLPPGSRPDILTPDDDLMEEEENDELDDLRSLPDRRSSTEDDSSSASSASSASSTGTIRPNERKGRFVRGAGRSSASNNPYSPLPWHSSFATSLTLTSPQSAFTYNAYFTPPAKPTSPLFILQHGAGCTGLTFAALATSLKELAPDIGLLAPDARGHGQTTVKSDTAPAEAQMRDGSLDMSLSVLANDLESTVSLTREKMGWTELPSLVLVGHSLGGAIVTEVAKRGKWGPKVLGLAVLDVVEGSAMDALKDMNAYLASRPKRFESLEKGIEWHVRSRQIRNAASARISVPSYLTPISTPSTFTTSSSPPTATDYTSTPQTPTSGPYTFLMDPTYTSPYWSNWFTSLSSKFLSCRGGKLLLLAGTDRLDRELMIGQMQGKYQLVVFPDSGHFIQEDVPEKTAKVLVEFWRRNDGAALVLPPKVGVTGIGTGTGVGGGGGGGAGGVIGMGSRGGP